MAESIEGRLSQANGRLKSGKIGVSIQMIGAKLHLQATLPPKPDSNKTLPHQQRIALGIGAHPRGVQLAEKEARRVGALLDCGEFSWADYMKRTDPVETVHSAPVIAEVVSQFETAYFQRRDRNAKTETTWNDDYRAVFKKLPQDVPLTEQILIEAILTTKPNTKQRRRYCMSLNALAKYAGIQVDVKALRGNYSPAKVTPRNLPTDEMIVEWHEKIPNSAWKWVYGMIATFGLRPHECFHIASFDGKIVEIDDDTKTGYREVWACYPEWVDEWNLHEMIVPKVNVKNNKEYGMRFNGYLNDNIRLPFEPYDLRHCWAIRTMEFGPILLG